MRLACAGVNVRLGLKREALEFCFDEDKNGNDKADNVKENKEDFEDEIKPDPDAGFSTATQVNPSVPQLRQQCVPDHEFGQWDGAQDHHHIIIITCYLAATVGRSTAQKVPRPRARERRAGNFFSSSVRPDLVFIFFIFNVLDIHCKDQSLFITK